LPLAINAVGKSLRNRTVIELWKNALSQLQCSVPHYGSSEEEIYLPLKLSYNSLPSKILQQCFLYCSLYPESFSINTSELIQCWIADGLIDAHQTLEESFNNGIALVENLKDTCMLEEGEGSGTVKMHDVLRDVAIWITLIEKKSGFSCQPNCSLHKMPDKLQKNCRRVSFMNNSITRLPSQLLGCSELTVLFLQGNPLRKIPDGFFREVRALRFLNLSGTHITSLPPSLLQLGELHALLLRDCPLLDKLPPLGALEKLQVLDLSGTRLRELPKEMCKLKNLRELNLSRTHHLEDIEAGTLSGLSSLEALDMSSSAYKWDVKCKTEQKTSLYELLSLEQFSVLHIRLDTVGCLALDSAWLGRLKKFSIEISPRSCSSNYLPNQHNESGHP
jgi:disease resistance protein RPS2